MNAGFLSGRKTYVIVGLGILLTWLSYATGLPTEELIPDTPDGVSEVVSEGGGGNQQLLQALVITLLFGSQAAQRAGVQRAEDAARE